MVAAGERAFSAGVQDFDFLGLDTAAFAASPAESIDYAVMEKTASGAVVRADMGWSDVGSWSELWEIAPKDAAGNVMRGDVQTHDATGCYVRAASRLVVALGVKDLLIVETDDAVLVGDRSRAQEVKDIVQRLGDQQPSEHVSHMRLYRPWGCFESIHSRER